MPDTHSSTTITFSQPFGLPGRAGALPPGDYRIEWQRRFLDDVAMPGSPSTEVRLVLGRGRGAEVLALPWGEIRAALRRDRAPAAPAAKPPAHALVDDPLVRLVMSSDGVTDRALRVAIRAARMRRHGAVALGGRGRAAPPRVGIPDAGRTPRPGAPI